MNTSVLPIFGFVTISLGVAAVVMLARDLFGRKKRQLQDRLGTRGGGAPLPQLPTVFEEPPPPGLIGRIDYRFARLAAETGLSAAPEALFLLAVMVGLVLGGGLFLWRDELPAGVAGMVLGMALVMGHYVVLRNRRRARIRAQLPDVMELMARAVRAGESLEQAFELIGETTRQPLGPEFRRCARQLDMGLSVRAAMHALAQRAPLAEMRILAATLSVQRHTGGNLPVTLERLSAVIRDRLSYYRQFRAATAAGRASATLIASAGPLVAVYLFLGQPDYADSFLATPQGHGLLATAILLQVVGLIWITRLLKTDY